MKHHSHQVLVPKARGLHKPLGPLAREFGCKVTQIEQKSSAETMLTKYFYTHDVAKIKQELADIEKKALEAGWVVLKTKVEHQGMHLVKQFSKETYAEAHIKISIPEIHLTKKMDLLKEVASRKGFWISRNPLEKTQDAVVQFLNFRFEHGSPEEANKMINDTIIWLGASNYDIVEVKRELVVFAS